MFIQIENVGKVREAAIEIDGITVIAGENNTGKSTVGRTLFAIFNGFCNVDETLMKERQDSIFRSLWELEAVDNFDNDFQVDASTIARNVIEQYRSNNDDVDQIVKTLKHRLLDMNKAGTFGIDTEELDPVLQRIKSALDIPRQDLLMRVLSERARREFQGQINNIYSHETSRVKLRIKNNDVDIIIEDNTITTMDSMLKLNTQAVYLDDEAIFCLGLPYFFMEDQERSRIIYSALNASREGGKDANILDSMMTEKKLHLIVSELDSISHGNLSIRSTRHTVSYEDPETKKELDISNLSSGLKIFALLKLLLLNGKIRDKGLIILDEPEIHLHPEWQIKFAELLVLLQKAFDLHVLLTTHSPYFIQAIEVYSHAHGIEERCRYYQAEQDGKMAEMHDVTNSIECIYKKLAEPFQILENAAYKD